MEKSITENKKLKTSLIDEIATKKRSINFSSLSNVLPDPDIVLKKQGKDIKIYKELLCDPHVFACVQSRKAGVQSLEWEINRGADKDKNVELITEILKKIDIYKLINDILNATLFGFQPIEIMWNKVGGLILPAELKAKPPEWFCFDTENNLRFRSKGNYNGEELPDKKFLCPQNNPSYDNPYGERILSKVFWPVTFKKGGMKFWVVFTEKYGMPHLVGKHPRGAGKEETETLASLLEDMVTDAIAVIPDDSSVEIKEANKTSSADIFEKLIDKMNAEISKAILGQTLTTEIGSQGSYAASNTHMQVRKDLIDADKKLVETTVNQLIRWIYELNFKSSDIPNFEMYEIEDVDLNLARRDKILSETGVKFTKEYFIKNYGFEEEDLEISSPPAVENAEFKQFSDEPVTEGQAQLEELFKFISETELSEAAQNLLNPLITLFESCESYEDLNEILNEKNLRSKKFEQDLQKALFLCELQGRADGLD
jgi:phage gp29-like protein